MNIEQLQEIVNESCGLSKNLPVLVGVSGGPDSLCLMDSLSRLGYPLIAAHFDHRLRQESRADAEAVEAAARERGLGFVEGGQDVAAYAQREQLSIEEAARLLRYRFLFEQASEANAQAVAVGHTADDQVETLLMHLIRGTGLRGLVGMPHRSIQHAWHAHIPLVRPLLSFWREETLAYCAEQGLQPRMDSTNQDLVYFRNRVRLELIPLLETYNPRVRMALYRTAQLLSGDQQIVQMAVEEAWRECLLDTADDEVFLSLKIMQELPRGLQRGLVRRSIEHLLADALDVDFAAIQRAEKFIQQPAAGQVELVRGLRMAVEQDALVISKISAGPRSDWLQIDAAEEQDLVVPGSVALSGGWRLEAQWVEPAGLSEGIQTGSISPWEAWLDAAAIDGELRLRCPRPGDRFQPLGMEGRSLKLSDFWINRKLPRRARAGWPLVISGGQILWVPGFQPSHLARIKPETRKALHLRFSRVSEPIVRLD